MPRFLTLAVAALGVVVALSYAVPAIGGPQAVSSANPVKLAKKALKRAKKADSRARKADSRAKKAQSTANQAIQKLSKNGGFLGANVQTVSSASITIGAMTASSGSLTCPAGTVVISGGYSLTGGEASAIFDRRSGNGWSVGVDNLVGTTDAQLVVDAQCVSTGNAVVASRSGRGDRIRDRLVLEQQRASRR
jgi:hypothetical protein